MKKLILVFIASFLMFYPSLFVFFTNDDFFLLKIANVHSLGGFLRFFNIFGKAGELGFFRPLTSQVFYFLDVKFFNLNPMPLHIISFITFFSVIYLVYRLAMELIGKEKVALIAAFLYGVSAVHFAHLYYLATFQELGMTTFVLLSILFFINKKNVLSFIFFILALTSKETAVVTPLLIVLVHWYKFGSFKNLFKRIWPFVVFLLIYLLAHKFIYGFSVGDEYTWDFSIKKLINTSFWYSLWSLNLPETLLDFIGPGLKVNPNLFIYWSKQFTPIFILFFAQGIGLCYLLFKSLSSGKKISLMSALWFFVALSPVIFLPAHKFTFYLTLPLVAVVWRIAYLFETAKPGKIFTIVFLGLWTWLSFLTIKHTVNTHWVTRGEVISKNVNDYFKSNLSNFGIKQIYLVDKSEDKSLPWSPTQVIKTALSDKNYFYVFYPELVSRISYGEGPGYLINSRIFLGY